MQKGTVIQGSLENTQGSSDATVLELLTSVTHAGVATVKVLSDSGNIAGAKVGDILRGFQVRNGLIQFS